MRPVSEYSIFNIFYRMNFPKKDGEAFSERNKAIAEKWATLTEPQKAIFSEAAEAARYGNGVNWDWIYLQAEKWLLVMANYDMTMQVNEDQEKTITQQEETIEEQKRTIKTLKSKLTSSSRRNESMIRELQALRAKFE
jgi:hypothetical protein